MRTKTLLAALSLLATATAPVSALMLAEELGIDIPDLPGVGDPPNASDGRELYRDLRDSAGLTDCSNGFVVDHGLNPLFVCVDGDKTTEQELAKKRPDLPVS